MTWSVFGVNFRQSDAMPVRPLTTFWRLVGPTGRPITCALYRTKTGLELRTCRGADLLYSLAVGTENQGADQAMAWKRAALACAGFREVDAEPLTSHRASCAECGQPIASGQAVWQVPFGSERRSKTFHTSIRPFHATCYRRDARGDVAV